MSFIDELNRAATKDFILNMRDVRKLLIKYTEWLNDSGYFNKQIIDYEVAEKYMISSGKAYLCGTCSKMQTCNEQHDKFTLACLEYELSELALTPEAHNNNIEALNKLNVQLNKIYNLRNQIK